jgi:hypothetical protein
MPLPPALLSRRRETLIRLPIGELSAWHLMVACGACRQDRVMGVGTLVARYGPDVTLAVLVPRLRCHVAACRQPPTQVRLRNRFPQKPGPELVEVLLAGG